MLRDMESEVQNILLPFLPMATLVVAVVSLLRDAFPRIDGWRVLLVAAFAAVAVPLWLQLRGTAPINWRTLATDAPAIWILAVGGTKWIQRIRDRAKLPPKDEEESLLAPADRKAPTDPDTTPLPVAAVSAVLPD